MKLTNAKIVLGIVLLGGMVCAVALVLWQHSPQKRVGRHVAKARINIKGGQLGRALAEYESALAINPSNAEVLAEIGLLRMALEQPERAAEAYLRCIELQPGQPQAWRGLLRARLALKDMAGIEQAAHRLRSLSNDAESLCALGDAAVACDHYDQAFGDFQEAQALAPGEYEPVRGMARLLSMLGREDEARQQVRAHAVNEKAADRELAWSALAESLRKEGRFQEELVCLEQALALKSAPELQVRRAEALFSLKRYREAGAELEAVFAAQPNPGPQARKARASCLFESGDLAGAQREAQIAQGSLPNDPQVALLLARIHHKNDRLLQSEDAARRALLLQPDYMPAQTFLMSLLLSKGLHGQAVALGRGLLDRPNVNEMARVLLAWACLADKQPGEARQILDNLRQCDFEGCEKQFEAWLSFQPESFEARRGLERVRQARRELAELSEAVGGSVQEAAHAPGAAEHARLVLNSLPVCELDASRELARTLELRRVLPFLGTLLMERGEFERAAGCFQQALQHAPGDVAALNNYTWLVAVDLQTPAQALPLAENLLRSAPDNAEALDTVGWVYFLNGKTDAALAVLGRGARLAPGSGVLAFHHGVVLHQQKRFAEAEVELARGSAIGGKLVDRDLCARLIADMGLNREQAIPINFKRHMEQQQGAE
jgi:tetratricopeptide (TPR) repeat protein